MAKHVVFDDGTKVGNGLWTGASWVPAGSVVGGRASPPRPIASVGDEMWWRAMQAEQTERAGGSPYARLWERDEAYLDDPQRFKVRHRVDPAAEPDYAPGVRIPAVMGRPRRSSLRTRARPSRESREYDELLDVLRGLKVKIRL